MCVIIYIMYWIFSIIVHPTEKDTCAERQIDRHTKTIHSINSDMYVGVYEVEGNELASLEYNNISVDWPTVKHQDSQSVQVFINHFN
jgi:hypothetical protein